MIANQVLEPNQQALKFFLTLKNFYVILWLVKQYIERFKNVFKRSVYPYKRWRYGI